MSYLLHIDTATDAGIVGVAHDGQEVARRVNMEARNHAGTINIMISETVAAAGITLKDLDGIVVCAGPGSYTGLRIGMATAKGLCYALDKPLLLDNRLTLLAWQAYNKQPGYEAYATLLTAREKEYFLAMYDHQFKNVLEPQHILVSDLEKYFEKRENIHITTDLTQEDVYKLKINKITTDTDINIDIKQWYSYAYEKYKCNDIVNLSTSEPFYLKQVYTHK